MNRSHDFWIFLSLCWFASCAPGGKGSPPPPNDPVPGGVVVAQGRFTGLNSKTVEGVAVVYRSLTSPSLFTVRLEGISAPSELGLEVQASISTGRVLQTSLRSSQGTQNYTVEVLGNPVWVSVSIHSSIKDLDYGKAILSDGS